MKRPSAAPSSSKRSVSPSNHDDQEPKKSKRGAKCKANPAEDVSEGKKVTKSKAKSCEIPSEKSVREQSADESPKNHEEPGHEEPEAKKPRSRKSKDNGGNEDGTTSRTFARRFMPNTDKGKVKWVGLREVYAAHVAPNLVAPSKHEDELGVRCYSIRVAKMDSKSNSSSTTM